MPVVTHQAKMAAMKKRSAGKNRESRLSVRVTRTDAARIARAAEANRLDVSAWARRTLLAAAEREDPDARRGRLHDALAAFESGVSPETARRIREIGREA